MKTLIFRGMSDDTFGEYGVTNQDVDTFGRCKPVQCHICADDGGMVIVGQYSVTHPIGGCWVIGASMMDEDAALPEWPLRIKNGKTPYSPDLEIDVPDDAELNWYLDGNMIVR